MNENSSMIVVLCSHLCAENCRPFEPSEWAKLADLLISQKLSPKDIADFTDEDMKQYLGYGEAEIERIKRLLDRAGSLGFELDKLASMGIKTITRADMGYPKLLKSKLKGGCPPMFYFAGDLSLLEKKTFGFVGSRTVGSEDIAFAQNAVKKVNERGFGVVSGGAKGIDSVSSAAAVSNGSFAVEYIADSLTRKIRQKDAISAILGGKLLVMSVAKPDAGFNTGMAMQRNKFIYAQSEASIVVKSDYNKGGTWAGASEAIKKEYCPVLCRDCKRYPGNVGLIALGAAPIGDDWDGNVPQSRKIIPDAGEQLSLFD